MFFPFFLYHREKMKIEGENISLLNNIIVSVG